MMEHICKAWPEEHVSQTTLQNARLRAGNNSENDLFLRIASEKYTMPRAAWNNGETCKISLHGDKRFRCVSVCVRCPSWQNCPCWAQEGKSVNCYRFVFRRSQIKTSGLVTYRSERTAPTYQTMVSQSPPIAVILRMIYFCE